MPIFPSGMYLVKVLSGAEEWSEKLVGENKEPGASYGNRDLYKLTDCNSCNIYFAS